jgi:hypothetical protein
MMETINVAGQKQLLVLHPDARVEYVRPDVVQVSRGKETLTFDLRAPVYFEHGTAAWFAEQLREAADRQSGA